MCEGGCRDTTSFSGVRRKRWCSCVKQWRVRHARPEFAIVFQRALLAIAAVALVSRSDAEPAKVVPRRLTRRSHRRDSEREVVLAGDASGACHGMFQHVDGVTSAVSGYAGGDRLPRTMKQYARRELAVPKSSASLSIRGKSATAASCNIFGRHDPDRTTRARTEERNIGQRIFR